MLSFRAVFSAREACPRAGGERGGGLLLRELIKSAVAGMRMNREFLINEVKYDFKS